MASAEGRNTGTDIRIQLHQLQLSIGDEPGCIARTATIAAVSRNPGHPDVTGILILSSMVHDQSIIFEPYEE